MEGLDVSLSAKALSARAGRAWDRQRKWETMLEEADSYTLPERNLYLGRGESGEGQDKMDRVYDSTAIISRQRFAARLQRDFLPPFESSFLLEPGVLAPAATKDKLKDELSSASKVIQAIFSHTEFATATHEWFLDLAAGRGNLLVLRGDKNRPCRFVCVPRAQVAIEEGPFGEAWLMARKRKIRAELIEHEYPGAKLPASYTQNPKKLEEEIELDEITFLDKRGNWQTHLIICKEVTTIWKQKYRKRGPWIILRWMKVPGEQDGRGPVLTALPDIRTLNKTIELLLMAAALAMSGVYTVTDDDVVNMDTVSIGPGMFIKVDSNGGTRGPSILPLETKRDFSLAQIIIDKLQGNIKQILMDDPLPPADGAVRSPTEIVQRLKSLQQDSGSAFGRLIAEGLIPLIQRVADVLAEFGLIEDLDIDQFLVRVQVTSPIARVQKLEEIKAIVDWFQTGSAIAGPEMGPQLMALCANIEDAIPYIGERLGVARELIRTPEQRAQIQQLIAKMVAAQTANSNAAPAAQPTAQAA